MKKKLFLMTFMVLLITPFAVWADDDPQKVDEMVVTATRSETSKDKIGGSSVTVITAEEIEAKKLNSVADLLKSVPGLEIRSRGGFGTTTSARIRGGQAKDTLILIDGVMLNDPSSIGRAADLAHITSDNIERIEVVRGPMSALYGTSAAAGVINIITKKGTEAPSVYGSVEGGSYNTWKAKVGATGKLKKFNFSLAAAQLESEGFSIANDDNDRIPHAGNTSEEDGYKNTTLSGKFGFDITPDFDINAVVRHISSEVDTDNSANGYTGDRFTPPPWGTAADPTGLKEARESHDQLFYKLDVHNFFFDRKLESKFYYQASDQEREYITNDDIWNNSYLGNSYEYGWQGGLNLIENLPLTGGYSYFKESYENPQNSFYGGTSVPEKIADITSFWGQGQLFGGEDFVFTGEVRSDNHKEFGTKSTYRLAPAYTIAKSHTLLKVSYGTGFRAPELYQLYAPAGAFGFLGGNPNLQPETSTGWDAGVEQPLFDRKVNVGATYFENSYSDRIYYAEVTPGSWTYTYKNDLGKSKTRGAEAFVKWAPLSVVDFTLNYTYTHALDASDDRVPYTPLNRFQFNTQYRPVEKLHLNLDAYWVDERDITYAKDKNGKDVEKLDDYTLVNISGGYDFNKHLQFYGRIDNLFDEYYEEIWSYATPGLSAYAGIKVTY